MVKKIICLLTLVLLTTMNTPAQSIEPASNPAFKFHRYAKYFMYGTLTSQYAEGVANGTEQPLLKFEVLDEPASLFFNFEIHPSKVNDLLNYLNLPRGFALAPIAILEGEAPRLYLTLNIYAVNGLQGLLSGNRAEWSIYVTKNGGRASFMIIDAKASELTLDAVDWFTPGIELMHNRTAGGLKSYVVPENGRTFASLVTSTALREAKRKYPEPSWISANDRIYWRNGVADRTYYDGDFVDTPVLSVDPASVAFTDNTIWRQFVISRPVSVLVYETGFELVISPWYNLDPE